MLLHFGGSEVRPSDKNITQCVFITTKSMPLPLVHIPLFNANLMSSCSFQVLINSKVPRFAEPVEKQIPSSQECRRGGERGERKREEERPQIAQSLELIKLKAKIWKELCFIWCLLCIQMKHHLILWSMSYEKIWSRESICQFPIVLGSQWCQQQVLKNYFFAVWRMDTRGFCCPLCLLREHWQMQLTCINFKSLLNHKTS